MNRFATMTFLCLLISSPAAVRAACGPAADEERLSTEAGKIIVDRYRRQVEAEAAIDHETAQRLVGLLFDLETGEPLALPEDVMAQHRRDVAYFAKVLRREASERKAAADEFFRNAKTCDGKPLLPEPVPH